MSSGWMDSYISDMIKLGSHPDKLGINLLTMKAADVRKKIVDGVSMEDIVGTIESRLLRVGPTEKLPLLYLIDSIMHNARGEYPAMFSKKIAYMYMDAYRETPGAKEKDSMKRLLGRWVNGDPATRPTPKALAKIHRDVFDPNFNEAKFISDQEHRFPQLSKQQAPPPPQQTIQRVMPPSIIPTSVPSAGNALYPPQNQNRYDDPLMKEAARLLQELWNSMGVPTSQQIDLNELRMERPEIYNEIMSRAHSELDNRAQVTPASSYRMPPSPMTTYDQGRSTPPAMPMDDGVPSRVCNWDAKFISGAPDAVYVARMLNHNTIEKSLFRDRVSLLFFEDQEALDAYQGIRDDFIDKIASLERGFSGLKSRGYFSKEEDWVNGVKCTMIVDGSGFEDDMGEDEANDAVDGRLGISRQDSNVSIDPRAYCVEEDENQTTCPITQAEFKRFWNDEEGVWMYEDAIRPDPKGPIYTATAYLEQNSKRKVSESATSDITKKPRLE